MLAVHARYEVYADWISDRRLRIAMHQCNSQSLAVIHPPRPFLARDLCAPVEAL